MAAHSTPSRRYRAGAATWLATGGLAAPLLVFAGVAGVRGSLGLALVAVVIAGLLLAGTARVELVLTPAGVRYRTLFTTSALAWSQIAGAWLAAPRGLWSYGRALPMLGVVPQQGRTLVLSLRALPREAIVDLAHCLAAGGTPVQVANTGPARRAAARLWAPPPRR
ncbi:PH domain-containing protein [Pseudoxanthomonas sp. JBR18]|uniref:PH domain-containing protein n=1 Tax=Pseudoxanthomonas sp. JBR18 TaxID=2969308 RepID=UPI002306630A|nr:PH domain-containing protein [Pseudoxanthomonas sp. JBR18]WCE05852.1 PH domain-containing protein [Pseudoxanthomonas sp. JBR18]